MSDERTVYLVVTPGWGTHEGARDNEQDRYWGLVRDLDEVQQDGKLATIPNEQACDGMVYQIPGMSTLLDEVGQRIYGSHFLAIPLQISSEATLYGIPNTPQKLGTFTRKDDA